MVVKGVPITYFKFYPQLYCCNIYQQVRMWTRERIYGSCIYEIRSAPSVYIEYDFRHMCNRFNDIGYADTVAYVLPQN